ncbi:MAG: glycosyltransferase [Saprospiraceae bacterium]|nr:glycosyltransferase [Saprospiraceae bacterium]
MENLLHQLPSLAAQKKGWFWHSATLPSQYAQNRDWKKLSIVIPSYNQGQYIEETLRSILLQNYPNLELIIIDGGSKDNTVEILQAYNAHIDYWVSEPDKGQSDAINKGLARATGDWLAFMNSDDGYLKDTFCQIFSKVDHQDFIFGSQGYVGKNVEDATLRVSKNIHPLSASKLLRFFKDVNNIIPSQSVFFSRALFEKVGYFDATLHYGMDLDWYIRAALLQPNTFFTDYPTYFYRLDEHAKTAKYQWKGFYEVVEIARKYALHLPSDDQKRLELEIAYDIQLRQVFSDKKKSYF